MAAKLPRLSAPSKHRTHSLWLLILVVAGLVVVVIGFATVARRTSDSDIPASLRAAGISSGPWLRAERLPALQAGVQDASAAPLLGGVLLLGGLNGADTSVPSIARLGPRGARVLTTALPNPLHDAAAASLGSSVYLFGGGQNNSFTSITKVDPRTGTVQPTGHLPQPRSDLAAATVNQTVYLVGGYTGKKPLNTILAWSPQTGKKPHVVGKLPYPLRYASVAASGGHIIVAGGITPHGPSARILSFDPSNGNVKRLGWLLEPISHAPAVALGRYVYMLGGRAANGAPTTRIFAIDPTTGAIKLSGHLPMPLSDSAAAPFSGKILLAGGHSTSGTLPGLFELSPAPRPIQMATTSLLRPGSDPSVLPGNVLIADKANNRLLEVSPQGVTKWSFPKPGQLAKGQKFKLPDDAFYSPSGKQIVATEEDYFVISVIGIAKERIVYRYGHPGKPGSTDGYLYNPDDAIMLKDGRIISADIKNCRLIELEPPLHRPIAQLGATASCGHSPPHSFGSPNGAFPLRDGGNVVTEINGDWIDIFNRKGHLQASTNPPGYTYPSDTNEVRPGVYLTVDWTKPGSIMKLTGNGRVLWEYTPRGADSLNHPSLALPLPNGDVLVNDDHNDRVIVVDPRTDQVVWQYGHKGVSGRAPGYLNVPDGLDLAPPYSLVDHFSNVTGLPRR